MKPGGGKGKGSSFERLVCHDLSLWISDSARDDLLWRSAISGGRATVRARKGKKTPHQAGDICAVHPLGHALTDLFYIETKFYKDLKAAALLFTGEGLVAGFWNVCTIQAQDHDKSPMLILRQNRYPVVVGLRSTGVDVLHVERLLLCSFPKLDLHIVEFDEMVKVPFKP